jgi:hypothetical protein
VKDGLPTRWTLDAARGVRCLVALEMWTVIGCSGGQPTAPMDATSTAGNEAGLADVPADVRNIRDGAIPLCPAPDGGETDGEPATCSVPRRFGTPYGCIDRHCLIESDTPIAIPVNTSLCAKPSGDGAVTSDGAAPRWSFESDDDECKFHVQLATTCATASDLSVTFALTKLIDGAPAQGAAPYVDVYLSITHFAPSTGTAAELGSGIYTISHIQLDASGVWTLEFHLYASCPLGTGSPHAHFTTFFEVP